MVMIISRELRERMYVARAGNTYYAGKYLGGEIGDDIDSDESGVRLFLDIYSRRYRGGWDVDSYSGIIVFGEGVLEGQRLRVGQWIVDLGERFGMMIMDEVIFRRIFQRVR